MASIWTPELRERAYALWHEGNSSSEIARVLHTTRGAVMGLIHRAGLKRVEPQRQPVRAKRIVTVKPSKLAKEIERPAPTAEPSPIGPIGDFPAHGCCQFIRGEYRPDFQMCGHPISPGWGKWCEYHRSIIRAPKKPDEHKMDKSGVTRPWPHPIIERMNSYATEIGISIWPVRETSYYAPTGEKFVELTLGGTNGACLAEVIGMSPADVEELFFLQFKNYVDGKTGTLYWRYWPEMEARTLWRRNTIPRDYFSMESYVAYASLLVSNESTGMEAA